MKGLLLRAARRLLPTPSETIHGYESSELVDVVFRKTVAQQPTKPWPEIRDARTVLDFGGGCGIHYKEARSKDVRWAVVETPAMVARARELETDRLRFFADFSQAAGWLQTVDVMHSNGALHFAADPLLMLKQLCGLRAKTMIWRRMNLSSDRTERATQSSLLSENGPGHLFIKEKVVRYDFTRIPERAFLEAHSDYSLVERGKDSFRFVLK